MRTQRVPLNHIKFILQKISLLKGDMGLLQYFIYTTVWDYYSILHLLQYFIYKWKIFSYFPYDNSYLLRPPFLPPYYCARRIFHSIFLILTIYYRVTIFMLYVISFLYYYLLYIYILFNNFPPFSAAFFPK